MTATDPAPAPVGRPRARARAPFVRAYAPIVVAVALLALVPLRYHDSRALMGVAVAGLLFAAYAIAFNVIFGSTGQLFLCVGALAGVGGYGSVILSDELGVPMIVAMALAALVSALVGGLLSWIAVSRSLDVIFTGIVTLAFSLSFQSLVLGRRDLTGGETGLRVEAGSETLLGEQVAPYYVFLGLVFVYLVLYRFVQRSRMGWALRALRDDEVAAELAGVDVTRHRVRAGMIGSAMLGLAGSLWAHSEGFIGPSTYAFGHVDIRVIVMLSFGGVGTLLGPILGAVVFTVLDEWLVDYSQLQVMLYGIVIVVLFLGFRRGVIPTLGSLAGRLSQRRRAGRIDLTGEDETSTLGPGGIDARARPDPIDRPDDAGAPARGRS
ncbi:MAG: branched-chain amino acid ABC transporter permease [Actinomycetota bacterium]|nr:branched-chain amino acid ABC transporter permease [Actinomycetota bacterium]